MTRKEIESITEETFSQYTEVNESIDADIIHVYPTEEFGKDDNRGYHDSKFFTIYYFNTVNKKKFFSCKYYDELMFGENSHLMMTRVFVDGSFLMRFKEPVSFHTCQSVLVG